MTDEEQDTTAGHGKRARARIIGPVSRDLKIASFLSVSASLLWPFQAGAIAWAVSGWAQGVPPMEQAPAAAMILVLCGILRALLDYRAGALLFKAADETIARERESLILREARSVSTAGSAAIAALVVQKLPLLQPWITRYYIAMARVSVVPVILLALSFSLSWAVGLVLLVAGPLIPVFMALVGMAAEDASRRHMDEIGSINSMLMERLSAMLDIRLLGAAEHVASDFEARADSLRERTMAVLRIAFLSSTVLELFSALGVALVAVFVGFSLLGQIGIGTWGTPLTLQTGLFLLLIAPDYFQPMRELAAAWHDRATGVSVVAELDALDAAERVTFVGKGSPSAPLTGAFSIRAQDAVAALPGTQIAIPDFAIGPGDTIAFTGPSGVGKSMALAALAGLVPLHSGHMEVCGHSLDENSADAWRMRVAFIPQKPHFPDMALSQWLDPKATGADPGSALALANARHIVERLPDGLATRLGETGGGVSGGEARRLMIARAIMSGGDVVFADEPTADLDREAAGRVIDALLKLNGTGRAIVVATHDPDLMAAMGTCVEVAE